MRKDGPEIIEIPQQEPDMLQKAVFWLAMHRKESIGFFAGTIVAVALLLVWQTPSQGLSEKLSFVRKESSKIQIDNHSLKTLSKNLGQLGGLKVFFEPEVLQKEMIYSQEPIVFSHSLGEGLYQEFSEASFLLKEGKKEEALAKTLSLAEKLPNSSEKKAVALIPYNLFRLYQIYESMNDTLRAKKVLATLESVLKTESGKQFSAEFAQKGVSLADWLKQRETR